VPQMPIGGWNEGAGWSKSGWVVGSMAVIYSSYGNKRLKVQGPKGKAARPRGIRAANLMPCTSCLGLINQILPSRIVEHGPEGLDPSGWPRGMDAVG